MSDIVSDSIAADRIDRVEPGETYSAQGAKRMLEGVIHQIEWLAAGLAERRAGLIWFLPLCHDGRDY